jgi:hypothetical protein
MRRLQWVGVRREMARSVHERAKSMYALNNSNIFDIYSLDSNGSSVKAIAISSG